jgi:NAD(P)-dependent dehydrogenase (short-subunit alcohol dehydrogenase family)
VDELRLADVRLPLIPGAALVTGATGGIGLAVATAFAAQGTPVAGVDQAAEGSGLVAACTARGARCMYLQRDVRDFAGAEAAVQAAEAVLGPASILVACAGIALDAASWKMTETNWQRVLDVDLTGCFTYARALAPKLRQRGEGRIVFVSSINGLRGKFGQANYAAAKAGLIGLAKTLARELGPRGTTVNVVAPGMVRTPMTVGLAAEVQERARAETVLGRLGEPEDVAAAVLYLCSPLGRHVTGEVLRVDGGQAM